MSSAFRLARPQPRAQLLEPRPKARFAPWAASGFALVSTAAAAPSEVEAPILRAPLSFDEAAEMSLVGGKNRPGVMVRAYEAEAGTRTRLSVHGVNASPLDVQPLVELGSRLEESSFTFAYDDRFRRLEKSADDLAREIGAWRTAHPDQPLVIDAHSMGGRIAVVALAELAKTTDIGPVELNLVAVPLAGYKSANWARTSPPFLRGLIPVTRPGVDMGTRSGFQKTIDRVVLPESVKTTIYVAGLDEVVHGADAHPTHVVNNLGASVVHLPDVTHVSIVARVAELLGADAE